MSAVGQFQAPHTHTRANHVWLDSQLIVAKQDSLHKYIYIYTDVQCMILNVHVY